MDVLSWIIALGVSVVTFGFLFLKYRFKHFERLGVPYESPHLFWGNLKGINKDFTMGRKVHWLYQKFAGTSKVYGMFMMFKPVTVVCDLGLIKAILIKDFNKLSDRASNFDEKRAPLSANLFSLPGDKWRVLRAKLTPSFSSGKLKAMTPIVSKLADHLVDKLQEGDDVNIQDIFARYTTDVIGNCAFGLNCNSLDDPTCEFLEKGNEVFHPKKPRPVQRILMITMGRLARRIGISDFPAGTHEFFYGVAKDTVEYRERENVHREDFLNSLIQMKARKELTMNELAAQVFLFQLAGYETSSITLTYMMYELAKNPEIQEQLRIEIQEAVERNSNDLSYEALHEMTYLDSVMKEALRKYPPGSILFRRVTVDEYQLPGTEWKFKYGDLFVVPVYGVHWDPELYPEPEKFRPERFLSEEAKTRHSMAFLAFGEGPRNCIGLRFAEMEIKLAVAKILLNYRVIGGRDFPQELEFKTSGIILTPKSNIFLKFQLLSSRK